MVEHAPTISSLRKAFNSRHSFSDWDLFTMQRSREEWELFKRWKNATQALGEVQALEVGDTLKVKAQSAFGNRHFLMRSPYPKVPLPAETLSIINVQSRPRNNNVDIILVDSDQDVTFAISAVKRSGVRAFSQVVIGTLGDNETKLCLKLYDERLFPIDAADDYDDRECREPSDRLNNLQFATDLARTEEAVYDRLDDLQGSMIPHFYGIHQFELPDGTILWGLLAEFIDCSTLQHVDASGWSVEAQIDFIRRMRHSFRALRYAGVLHNDEEARNVLCPDIGEKGFGALGIVIIDFAHSKLWLHDDNGTPPTYWSPRISPHWRPLLISARISEELVEEHWEPLNEIEF
ncbi:hypothetical protein OBBRIDRAFT_731085 [Obba rivulosa]|uniref:Protein kinase domain-containing protein n=1 Tax=Obba rivulosa TaxID=1052685 RepID=A0A8E2B155_9APHY|nr:hypothetical protein OBBRIDRAFT_731085 [Obba rivulosa]